MRAWLGWRCSMTEQPSHFHTWQKWMFKYNSFLTISERQVDTHKELCGGIEIPIFSHQQPPSWDLFPSFVTTSLLLVPTFSHAYCSLYLSSAAVPNLSLLPFCSVPPNCVSFCSHPFDSCHLLHSLLSSSDSISSPPPSASVLILISSPCSFAYYL